MPISAQKYMEQLYTLQTLVLMPSADPGPSFVGVNIDAVYEDNWIKKLGFTKGTPITRHFYHASLPDFRQLNIFDVLAIIWTVPEEFQESPFAQWVAFNRIVYDPAQAAGSRLTVYFHVANASGFDLSAIATIGLSHSINR